MFLAVRQKTISFVRRFYHGKIGSYKMETYVVFNDIADEHWSQKSRKIGKHVRDAH